MFIPLLDDVDFRKKSALVRADLSVPVTKNGGIIDDTRICAIIPTLNKILAQGGRCIVMSHLGRPGNRDPQYSLKQVIPTLEKRLGASVKFVDDCIGSNVERAVSTLNFGEVMVLENLRFHKEEQQGDKSFAKKLSRLGEIYVNDAFSTSHRAHASTTTITQFFRKKCAGEAMRKELASLKRVFHNKARPFTAIVGGAKVSDKIMMLENLMTQVDHLIIGGGMAYTFFKALGGVIGQSLVENDKLALAKRLVEKASSVNTVLHLPSDSVIADRIAENALVKNSKSDDIPMGWTGLDIGPQARHDFSRVISMSKTILWNGPMGLFEMDRFAEGTRTIGHSVGKATKENNAFSLLGGGDSVAAATRLGLQEKVTYISTGGGALLHYAEGRPLPGLEALK